MTDRPASQHDDRSGHVLVRPAKTSASSAGSNWIEFTPTQTWSTSDDAFSATIDVIHGSVPDAVDDAVTINNTRMAFSGNTSSLGICAMYDSGTDAYYCINIGCPPA